MLQEQDEFQRNIQMNKPSNEEEDDHNEIDKLALLPKDKGWAWMCVLGCFGINALVVGAAAKSFGVLFLEIVQKFNSTKAAATWITALDQCLALLLGPVANTLAERFTSRKVIFFGGWLMFLGLILSMFAPTLEYLYFSYGLLVGVGSALSYAPSIVTVGQYFEKRRSLANGISVSGSGVGNFLIPPLMRILLDFYGLNGALLILSAVILNVSVCGMLMRPPSYYAKLKQYKYKNKQVTDESKTEEAAVTHVDHVEGMEITNSKNFNHMYENQRHDSQISHQSCHSQASVYEAPYRKRLKSHSSYTSDIIYASFQSIPQEIQKQSSKRNKLTLQDRPKSEKRNEKHKKSVSCLSCPCRNICTSRDDSQKKKVSNFDFGLLKNTVFLCYAFSVFFAFSGYPNLFIIIPAHAESVGVTKTQVAYLVSLVGLFDLIGRILFGWFFDLPYVPKRYGYILSIGLAGISCLFGSYCKTFIAIAIFSSVVGFIAGAFMALTAPILAESLGIEKLPSAFGLCVMFMGSSFLYAPTLVGFLADITGNWAASFYFTGSVMVLSAFTLLLIPLAERREKRIQSKEKQAVTSVTDQLCRKEVPE